MLAKTTTYSITGVTARPRTVEVDIRSGLPAFSIVGIADTAVREARERVRAAILNEGFEFPQRRITVNITPATPPHLGPSLDLPIAVAVLAASGQIDVPDDFSLASIGELALDGSTRAVRGTLTIAEAAENANVDLLLVPRANLREAQLANGRTRSITRLADLNDVLADPSPSPPEPETSAPPSVDGPDLRDLRGHTIAIRALTIAAAGGHSILFEGPPGCGKTMLARRLPSILPPMTLAEALEVTKLQSLAGSLRVDGLAKQRPFRAPHHSVSAAGLTGGGAAPMPGELSLASHGVLFLDELAEFSTRTLESLRVPLEQGSVEVTRAQETVVYPARTQLIAATNPCPCGASPNPNCRCTQTEIDRYNRRLAGPLLDRFDMRLTIARPTPADVEAGPLTDSALVRQQVLEARKLQVQRFVGTDFTTNASLDGAATRRLLKPPDEIREALNSAYRADRLSLRGYDRTLRIARTIADLDGRADMAVSDIAEALSFHAPATEMAVPA